ncbi:metallohydrolase [Rhizobium leguminosarum]|nr:metallohydrolase [Rhizobium leguminosarum]
MADQLLVRMFNVGLGDFIYCAIPNAHADGGDFHVVIDCGTLSSLNYLRTAVPLLKEMLPLEGKKRRIDLLIITHKHKDHMAGFGLPLWKDVAIKAIWMSAAMEPGNPQAKKAKKLHDLAGEAMLQADTLRMRPEFDALFGAYAADNDDAVKYLTETIPAKNGIKAEYVHAGQSSDHDLKLPLKDCVFHILGPEQDVDHWYVGNSEESSISKLVDLADRGVVKSTVPSVLDLSELPGNIAPIDFRNLQSRMLSSALAFSEGDGTVVNNTSIVLLIVWNGKRLLFVGDAEWIATFKDGQNNGSWNTMWNRQNPLLNQPIDFLKVGHHGSINATPWGGGIERKPSYEPSKILDAILPKGSTAFAGVSTVRGNYKSIPEAALLSDIGQRVANSKNTGLPSRQLESSPRP